jgi:hypothetical protein
MRLPMSRQSEQGKHAELKLDNVKAGETIHQASNLPDSLNYAFYAYAAYH